MIPKIIHYCWFGRSEMPKEAKQCIASWHRWMPDWEYRLWNEDNFSIGTNVYAKEAYEARKFAFVSDYVRLWALERDGGVYLDTDVEVFKSFDDLLRYKAFAGFEGSKHLPLGTCVMASEAHGDWVSEQLAAYSDRHFINTDGSFDMTTNVQFISAVMRENGFKQNGKEQDYKDMHIFPIEFFCPRQTTGEYLRTDNTYCEHLGLGSWNEEEGGWKEKVREIIGQNAMTRLLKLKRCLFG